MPPIWGGIGRLSTRITVYAVDTLERFSKRLEVAARYAPIGSGPVVEVNGVLSIVAYKLVTHFKLPNNMARCH